MFGTAAAAAAAAGAAAPASVAAGAAMAGGAATAAVFGARAALDEWNAARPLAWSDVLARQGQSKPTAPSADKRGSLAREGGIGGRPRASDVARDRDTPSYMDKVPRRRARGDLQGTWREKLDGGRGRGNVFGGQVSLDDTLAKVPSRGTGVGGSWARPPPKRSAGSDNTAFPQ